MPICNNRKIFFVHVPKTAGTTIEEALNLRNSKNIYDKGVRLDTVPVTRQHLYASELLKESGIKIKGYYAFAVVRNPFDRLVSEYGFMPNNYFVPEKIKSMRFEEFVRTSLKMDPLERRFIFDGHLELQSNYVDIENVKIFKYENLSECFDELNKKFGPLEFGHHLKTDRKHWEEYYTPELKEFVYDFYKEDFTRFGYIS